MRIISGKHKGKRLQAPKNLPVRPTTDRCKEALFNILNNHYHLEDLRVLDLFSGTGNIAFEFASRGASDVVCVDQNQNCVRYIQKISKELDLNLIVQKKEVLSFLKHPCLKAYDLIFADPPYDVESETLYKMINAIFENKWIVDERWLIIEHAKQTKIDQHPMFAFEKNYGSSTFSFFEKTT